MIITKNKVASLSYSLTIDDFEGKMIETVGKEQAVEFLFGAGKLLPAFELALEGKKSGDDFRFHISTQEAYGKINPEAVVEIPKDIFVRNGELNEEILSVGNEIPMMDNQGRRMNGIVKEVKETTVVMDFNHPMAGNDLYFQGIVGQVRDASDEELNPPQGCGCGSGGCDSSESEGESCCSTKDDTESHQGGCGCGA